MFQLLKEMQHLLFFLEILGFIAIALMILQIFLTIGLLACNETNESSNASSNESLHDSSKRMIVSSV